MSDHSTRLNHEITVTINGTEKPVPGGISLSALLSRLGVTPERVAVEVNLTVIDRSQFSDTRMQEGDCVEIVSFVGGGNG